MRPLLILVILFLALLNFDLPVSEAASPSSCTFKPWPHARKLSPREFHRRFDQTDRHELIANYFYELSRPQDKLLPRSMATYLIQTEANTDLRAFYTLLRHSGDLDVSHGKPTALSSTEICEIYSKVLARQALARSPKKPSP